MTIVHGLNLLELGEQFELHHQDRVLLLDGDFLIYRAAAKAAKLDTAVRRFYTSVLEYMFLVGVKECRIFITPTGCAKCQRYHYPTVKLYQDNRKNKVEMPLKGPLKQHLLDNPSEYAAHGISIGASDWFEADDLILIHAHELMGDGVVCSDDKDMRLTPYPWWDNKTGQLMTIPDSYGLVGIVDGKPVGHGRAFFWMQMLMGDAADNVKGILTLDGKNCGPVTAWEFLKGFKTETEAANAVCQAYAAINQNVLAEAEMMWLRRTEDDSAYAYLMEVVTDDSLRGWIQQLHDYHLKHLEWVLEQEHES